jgi:hypothetical protein
MKEKDRFIGYSKTDGMYHFLIGNGDARWAFDKVKLIPYGSDEVFFLNPNGCIMDRNHERVNIPQLTTKDLYEDSIWLGNLYSKLGIHGSL